MGSDQVQAVAAVATFLAACVAVWATFKAPERAALFAEKLRETTVKAERAENARMSIFTTMMEYRGHIASIENVRVMNLIDVTFSDRPMVRQAWRHFNDETLRQPADNSAIFRKYLEMLDTIASDLGMGGRITRSDIETVYYPEYLRVRDQTSLPQALAKNDAPSSKDF